MSKKKTNELPAAYEIYFVRAPLLHDGDPYLIGEEVELMAAEAAPLLAAGVIEKKTVEKAMKPDAPTLKVQTGKASANAAKASEDENALTVADGE